ncbi:hypothetical protein J0X14_14360 [Muricauda sp. CAU 1633]|uniref:hypothetical protein n=1 Tax=Allomuricauda sp. CAU 1633 TaxID=2816036 RepID=UPI001A8D80CC|nr:hypothetical protein [Muricauda sp. CAU 1633]MBO0323488.1 hypothetical protein [Muricauda sp. CAU 1633]
MAKPTENDLEKMGFDFIKAYDHDEWYTNRYKKGTIEVEFTYRYDTNELETFDIIIDETFISPSKKELETLDKILNKKTDHPSNERP